MTEATGASVERPIGVMLVNLGSPDEPTIPAVRRYLDEFLGDHMVIDAPRLIWWLVRKLIILPRRPKVAAHAYSRVWTPDGPPLVVHSRRQADGLGRALGSGFRVAVGMRYGSPSLGDAARSLAGCERVVFLPMFPQMSRTSLGTALVAARRALTDAGLPIIEVAPYYDHPAYIDALAERLRESITAFSPDHILLSFHGLPVRLVEKEGDPYRDHCEATAAALVAALGLRDGDWTMTYQSRFGREPWLGPATADVVTRMASTHRRLLVACPGFPSDCLETLEEIGMTARDSFIAAGGEELRLVPCLNDSPRWIDGMATIVRETLARV